MCFSRELAVSPGSAQPCDANVGALLFQEELNLLSRTELLPQTPQPGGAGRLETGVAGWQLVSPAYPSSWRGLCGLPWALPDAEITQGWVCCQSRLRGGACPALSCLCPRIHPRLEGQPRALQPPGHGGTPPRPGEQGSVLAVPGATQHPAHSSPRRARGWGTR